MSGTHGPVQPEGFLDAIILGRLFTRNNVLAIFTGPTGIGKSWGALKMAERYDPTFNPDRIVFTAKEFLDIINEVPPRGFVVWDEPGVGLGHRKWGSPENIAVTEIMQSFRYMYKNVLFATPRRGLIDIVVRHLLHVEFKMRSRGYALVYLIFPSDFSMEGIVTPFAGHLKFGPPSKWLTDAYEQKREEHGRKLLEKSKKIVDAAYQKFEEGIDRTLKSKTSWEDKLEIGRKFLPLCLDQEKLRLFLERGYEGRGVVDMMKFRNLCNFAHSESYFVRDALLKELKDKALGKVESKDSKEEKS